MDSSCLAFHPAGRFTKIALIGARSLPFIIAVMAALSTAVDAKIHRNASARSEFKRLHPCPATGNPSGKCPGYIIDHITPLACRGADAPSNMQWQTVSDAKAKDRWERKACP